jgi:hypothetical protein
LFCTLLVLLKDLYTGYFSSTLQFAVTGIPGTKILLRTLC